jgi:hypothetical protein
MGETSKDLHDGARLFQWDSIYDPLIHTRGGKVESKLVLAIIAGFWATLFLLCAF